MFSDDYQGLVIKVSLKGINSNEGLVSIASGESWHESVLWTLKKNLFGSKNIINEKNLLAKCLELIVKIPITRKSDIMIRRVI